MTTESGEEEYLIILSKEKIEEIRKAFGNYFETIQANAIPVVEKLTISTQKLSSEIAEPAEQKPRGKKFWKPRFERTFKK